MIEQERQYQRERFVEHPSVLRDKIVKNSVAVVGVLIAVLATQAMVITESNPLAVTVKMAAPLAFLIGVIWPKAGLAILVAACCYLDLTKRIAYWIGLYAAGNQGTSTLQIDILSFAPVTLFGVFCGIITPRIFGTKRIVERHEWPFLAFVFAANGIAILNGLRNNSTLSEIGTLVSGETLYTLLIFIVPVLFTKTAEIIKFLKYILIVFLPCAIYGIWQGRFGFTALDIAWMKSGLTITEQLMFTKARAFGTLASPHPYTVLYWLVILCGALFFREKRGKLLWLAAALINSIGLFYGYGRGAWVSLIATIIAYFCFKKRSTTWVFYGGSIVAFAFFVKYAQFFLDHLEDYQTALPITSETTGMVFNLGTFSERLFSIQNWTTNSRMWSWFGRPELLNYQQLGYDEIVHDMLGQVLVRYGAVGLFGGLGFALLATYEAHRRIWGVPDKQDRNLATLFLAMLSVNFITAGSSGASYQVFPWNFFIWLLVGFLIVLCRRKPETELSTKPQPLPSRMQKPNLSARLRRPSPAF